VLWAAQQDTSRPGRPKLRRPLRTGEGSFARASAAEPLQRESSVLTASREADISAERMDRVRRKDARTESRINSGDLEERVSAAATDSKDGEERL
jgi:hypothetical protein